MRVRVLVGVLASAALVALAAAAMSVAGRSGSARSPSPRQVPAPLATQSALATQTPPASQAPPVLFRPVVDGRVTGSLSEQPRDDAVRSSRVRELSGLDRSAVHGAGVRPAPLPDSELDAGLQPVYGLAGTLTGPDGPVVGAQLELLEWPRRCFDCREAAREHGWRPDEGRRTHSEARARTGPHGRFLFRVQDMERGCLTVEHPGFVPMTLHGVVLGYGRPESLDLRLEPGLCIRGRVVDLDGQPAGGVGVIARHLSGGGDPHAGPRSAYTDGAGCFVLGGIAPGRWRLSLNTRGRYLLPVAGPVVQAGDQGVEFRVVGTGSLVVRGQDGNSYRPEVYEYQLDTLQGLQAPADIYGMDGSTRIAGLLGRYRLRVRAAGGGIVEQDVRVAPGQVTEVSLRMPVVPEGDGDGAVLYVGRAVEFDGVLPNSLWADCPRPAGSTAETLHGGRYIVSVNPPEPPDLEIRLQSSSGTYAWLSGLPPGGGQMGEVCLGPGRMVTGRAVGPLGMPVGDLMVRWGDYNGDGMDPDLDSVLFEYHRTDEQGGFLLQDLPPWPVFVDVEFACDTSLACRRAVPVPAGSVEVVVEHPLAGGLTMASVRGRVSFQGSPVAGQVIRFAVKPDGVQGVVTYERVVDAQGRYVLDGVPPGRWRGEVSRGLGEPVFALPAFRLSAGARQVQDFDLGSLW